MLIKDSVRKLVWRGAKVEGDISRQMAKRVRVAGQVVKDQTMRNISVPVVKIRGPNGVRVDPDSRSKDGEFPRADTTRLMKDIFTEMISTHRAVVGTTLDYGFILEFRRNRSFLRRTLLEMMPMVRSILTKPLSPR